MEENYQNMYKVGFTASLLLILKKINIINDKLTFKIKNKTFL